MRRGDKEKRTSKHHKQERKKQNAAVGQRGRAASYYLFPVLIALLLVLAAAVAWQRLSLSSTGETAPASSAADATLATGEHGPVQPTERQKAGARVTPTNEKIRREGVEVAFSVAQAQDHGEDDGSAELSFTLTDAATGAPLSLQSQPAVWVDLEKGLAGKESNDSLTCQDKVKSYAQGSLGFRPDIDLNSYYVLALNSDATISVIDPLVGVTGISQLYAMVFLNSRGEDWVASSDDKRLFVTMPQAGQVAVIDTESFKVIKTLDVGDNPSHLALQPDGVYLWVANDSGVAVIDAATLRVVAQIRTGAGPHEISFHSRGDTGQLNSDGDHGGAHGQHATGGTHHAFVTNKSGSTVSIVDVHGLEKVNDVDVGRNPTSLDFSTVSNAIYVASQTDGIITVIDGESLEPRGRVNAAKGASTLRFAPGGRWGFVLGGGSSLVQVLDASTNSIVYGAEIAGEPDSITFTDDYAYIRSTRTADISLIDLSQLGRPEKLAVSQIIGGQKAPSESPFHAGASPVVPLHGNHVLIANPADAYIYYYMEGMKAPMGGFQNYGRVPTAVRVVDRGLRQTAPGVFSAEAKLPKNGRYQVAFLLDTPRIVDCFSFTTEASSSIGNEDRGAALRIQVLSGDNELRVGEPRTLRFTVTDVRKDEPVAGLDDVQIVAMQTSGLWSERYRGVSTGSGVYETNLTIPRPGVYSILFAIPSLNLSFNQVSSLNLNAY